MRWTPIPSFIFFKDKGQVAQHLFSLSPQEIALPAIVLYELEVGIAKSTAPEKRRAQLNELLKVVRVLPFAEKEALISAQLRASLEQIGTPIGPLDVMVAGTALANKAILVKHNTKEFSRVDSLRLEDWLI